jgi:hypothetical protein
VGYVLLALAEPVVEDNTAMFMDLKARSLTDLLAMKTDDESVIIQIESNLE